MPEPLTVTLVGATVVSVAMCVYKTIDRVVSAPREMVQQTGKSAEDLVKTFALELQKLFLSEPRISVNRRVVQVGGESIRELALYKETVLIKEDWTSTRWKSTKIFRVQQPFTVKAGFDLNRLKLEFDPIKKQVTVTISESTIVSVEYAGDYEILKEEHGLWNRISLTERDQILNSLPQKAQEEAEHLQLREKASARLQKLLISMLPPDLNLIIRSTDDTVQFRKCESLRAVPAATLSQLGISEVIENIHP